MSISCLQNAREGDIMIIYVGYDGFMAASRTARTKNYVVVGIEHYKESSTTRSGKRLPPGDYPIVRLFGDTRESRGTTVRASCTAKIIKATHPDYLEMMARHILK